MSTLPFEKAKIVELWCAEPVFFASRELSDTYYTEGAGTMPLPMLLAGYVPPIAFKVRQQDDQPTKKI
jgi:hypothetical protein